MKLDRGASLILTIVSFRWSLARVSARPRNRKICYRLLLFSVPALAEDGVTVMTRNMYFGADLTPAIAAPTVPAPILAATHVIAGVNASDVPSRVDGMAAEIANARPDLVGLQEVAIWRAVYPPTFSPTGFDFLELDALAARGEHYVVVATHVTNDLQAPALCPNTPPFSCIGLVRFIDRQ